jgi:Ca2+-binding RTX toxin-like protein
MAGSYTLELELLGVYSVDMPGFEIWTDGTIEGTPYSISSSGTSISITVNYGGALPSSLEFRFNDASGEGGRTIEIQSVKINNKYVNTANYLSSNTLTNGGNATVNVANSEFIFDASEPTGADFLPATRTFTAGNDSIRLDTVSTDESFDMLGGRDVAFLGSGNDTVNGGAGDDYIRGGGGDDLIYGGADNDRLFGDNGNDLIYGGAGDDAIYGGNGADEIHGNDGDDKLHGQNGDDVITGGAGNDVITGGNGSNFLFGDAGNDQIMGGHGVDTIDGGDDDDVLYGGGGDDIIEGGNGNDIIVGDDGDDRLDGNDGADYLYGRNGADTLNGGAGNDVLNGENGADIMDGGADNDVLIGADGADIMNGGAGDDILHGSGLNITEIITILQANPSVVYNAETNSFYQYVNTTANYATALANAQAATLNGVGGHLVTITSAAENTFIDNLITGNIWLSATDSAVEGMWVWNGGAEDGVNFWNGVAGGSAPGGQYENWNGGEPNDYGAGEDTAEMRTDGLWNDNGGNLRYVIEWDAGLLSDDLAIDTINGGDGNDYIYGYGGADILDGGEGDDIILGGDGDDTIIGSNGNDVHYGQDGNDTIGGGGGADYLYGGAGDDIIDGGNVGDVIYGNEGSDTLDGGNGGDTIYTLDASANFQGNSLNTINRIIYNENFSSGTGAFTYADGGNGGSDGANVDVTGTRITSDGAATASGALQVYIDGQNNSSFTNASGNWGDSYTATANLTDVQITFSYRHIHSTNNDNGEDSGVWFTLDGTRYDDTGGNGYLSIAYGSGGETDTGWVTVTIDLPDLTSGNTYNIAMGITHAGASRANEDAEVRFDDIFMTAGETYGSAATATADADENEVNVVNGGNGDDTIYGSSGTDTLNGDDGNDTIYSGSVDTSAADIAFILANNAGVSYSAATGSFYQVVSSTVDWTVANTAANSATLNGLGSTTGHLVTITSAVEQSFVEGLIGGNSTWLGGGDFGTEGVWRWTSGPEAGTQFANASGASVNGMYSNFTPGQPNDSDGTQDYLYMLNGGQWADLVVEGDGSTGFVTVPQYIIEWEASALYNRTTLSGGDGLDTLYGSSGADTFLFEAASAYNDLDVIENFGYSLDSIDLSDLLSGYNPLTHDINDFVRLTEGGGNTTISVDANGTTGGVNFSNVAIINGITGLDVDTMELDGTLIV